MINLKKILPYATLLAIVIGLITYVWADTIEKIKSKADNTTVIRILEDRKIQRAEDREDDKEARRIAWEKECQQNVINQKLLESVQMLMIEQKKKDSQ